MHALRRATAATSRAQWRATRPLVRLQSQATPAASASAAPTGISGRSIFLGALGLGAVSSAYLLYLRIEHVRQTRAVEAMPILPGNPLVYLDIADNDEVIGRIVIQLRADTVPRTAENFRQLCIRPFGYGYVTTALHHADKSRRVYGGDFFGAGLGGASIYGDTFEDESFELRHVGPGTVGMRNYGPGTNNSQFYVTMKAMPELDGRSVVVGYLVDGWDVLAEIDKGVAPRGGFYPEHEFRIAACGQLPAEWRPRRTSAAGAET